MVCFFIALFYVFVQLHVPPVCACPHSHFSASVTFRLHLSELFEHCLPTPPHLINLDIFNSGCTFNYLFIFVSPCHTFAPLFSKGTSDRQIFGLTYESSSHILLFIQTFVHLVKTVLLITHVNHKMCLLLQKI